MLPLVHLGTKVSVTWGLVHEGEILHPTVFDFTMTRLDDAAFESLKALIRQRQDDIQKELANASIVEVPLPADEATDAAVSSSVPAEPNSIPKADPASFLLDAELDPAG